MVKTRIMLPFFAAITITFLGIWGITYASSISIKPHGLPATIYVDADNASGTYDGLSWTTAFTTVQDALAFALNGDEIWVAEGVYYPDEGSGTTDNQPSSTFALNSGVRMYGGFDPDNLVDDFSERDWETYPTVLSGDLAQDDTIDSIGVITTYQNITGTNAFNVVYLNNLPTQTPHLEGLIITGGYAAQGSTNHGGGIYNLDSDLNLKDVLIIGNDAFFDGGGLYAAGSSILSLTGVTFSVNHTGNEGGGFYNHAEGSTTTLKDVTFSGNYADGGGGGMVSANNTDFSMTDVTFTYNTAEEDAGGLYIGSTDPPLTNLVFSFNHADGNGGGMVSADSSPTMTNTTFISNTAGSYGGGMYNSSNSTPTLIVAAFTNNTVEGSGGGMANSSANPDLYNVTFSDNTAFQGGGMYNIYSEPDIYNTTFTGNLAESGGGMYNTNNSHARLYNVIFSGNYATMNGGGIYRTSSLGGFYNVTITANQAVLNGGGMYNAVLSNGLLKNVILWGNFAWAGSNILNDNSQPNFSYSNIEGSGGSGSGWASTFGVDGGSNIDADPLYVRNPDPGDINWATRIDNDYGDLHLQAGSPSVDTGTNTDCPAFDLEGNPRPIGLSCDMGAYERLIYVFAPLMLK